MNETERTIRAYIEETGMLCPGDRVLAAVSGGGDSVFLLHVLKNVLAEYGLSVRVVHVHHGIRGPEADRDARFTEEYCEKLQLPFYAVYRDVPAEAAKRGMSLEEAGRAVRYEIFEEEAALWDCEEPSVRGTLIALAHHLDDQAETVLFRAARGTGLWGLQGMRPVEGRLIRPLLAVSKEEIRKEIVRLSLPCCEDSTNWEDDAARNRIRHRILPLLETEVNAGAGRHLARLGALAAQAEDFIAGEADARAGRYIRKEQDRVLVGAELSGEHALMQAELIRRAFAAAGGGMKDLGFVHVDAVRALLQKEAGCRADLPGGLAAERTREGVLLKKRKAEPPPLLPRMEMTLTDELPDPVPQKRYTKWIDYDKMSSQDPVLRYRFNGDYIVIDREGHRKSLSDYLTDEKVPMDERDRIPLLCIGSEIIWVIGMRLSARFYITEETKRVLRLSCPDLKDLGEEQTFSADQKAEVDDGKNRSHDSRRAGGGQGGAAG